MEPPDTRLETVLSSFTDAVLMLDLSGGITWINPAAEQFFGISVNQAVGKDFARLFPPGSPAPGEVQRSIQNGVSHINHDISLESGGGRQTPVVLTVHPFEDERGGGATVILRDLSGIKALELSARLQERVAEISTLTAGIAHEIKNPLGGIRGSAQLIGAETSDDSITDYAELIIRESDRINRLITDLIKMNQPDDFPKQAVNIYTVLDDVIKILAPETHKKNIMIERDYDPSLPLILGDADRLSQIFINLIKNSVEAIVNNGTITIRTGAAMRSGKAPAISVEKRYALVEIIDNGPGIDEKSLPHIFTPFFSGKASGTGLGLPITLQLVQAHGGLLQVSGRADGRGAIASVYLPYVTGSMT